MTSLLDKIGEFKPEAVAPVLKGDWKLVFVDSAEAIHQVGSGLGKLPGSSIEDLFASIDAKGTVTIQEVVRVVGPFPNVMNELSGTWEYKDKSAGFTGDSVSEPRLECVYTEMVDGRNKRTTAEQGFKQKSVQLDVRYCCPSLRSLMHICIWIYILLYNLYMRARAMATALPRASAPDQ